MIQAHSVLSNGSRSSLRSFLLDLGDLEDVRRDTLLGGGGFVPEGVASDLSLGQVDVLRAVRTCSRNGEVLSCGRRPP